MNAKLIALTTNLVILLTGSTAMSSGLKIESGKILVLSQIEDADLLGSFSRTAETALDQSANFFGHMGLQQTRSEKTILRVYSDRQKMMDETPPNAAKEVSMLGFFNHDSHETGVLHKGHTEETNRIIAHEIIHQQLHNHLTGFAPPAWLDEGVAELLSRDPSVLSTMTVTSIPPVIKTILETAKASGTSISLDELFLRTNSTFYGTKQDINYATAYVFAAYLIKTEGARGFGNLVTALSQGQSVSEWLSRNGKSVSEVEASMLQWALAS